jgi:N-acetylated-alpha-linked acidic dipeptidase
MLQSVPAFGQQSSASRLMGFISKSHSQHQLKIEKQFIGGLNNKEMRQWMKRIAAKPHNVGSAYDKANALFIDSLFKQWGFGTRIDTYYVLYATPKIRKLEMVSPKKYKAVLKEKAIPGDSYTAQKGQLPPFYVYSPDGNVTGDLVYVNYGTQKDYRNLAKMGVSVKGKIVIVRYGAVWRGVKPELAYKHGAIGCIIYSDPKEDGYHRGDVYPKGPWKNAYDVQRGSVERAPIYQGGPLTPGYAATKNAKRLSISESKVIQHIPVLPISYHDAKPLLSSLGGPVAPRSWRGALPITYHVGPGPAKVHLKLKFNWKITPIHDVIATIKGSKYPNEWVMRGNHEDAWVNGAADPVAGLVAELGEAKSIGSLVKQGWQPKRTIVYCVWDGEEPGLLGSTEFAEGHAKELKRKAVTYINSDNNSRGFLHAGGSPLLGKSFFQVAFSVRDPEIGISVGQRRLDNRTYYAGGKRRTKFPYYALGTGSDYASFLDHLGIASIDLKFSGEGAGGEYHTNYDDYIDFTRFKDPGFKYEVALAKVAGKMVLRLADADILPFSFEYFHKKVEGYVDDLQDLASDMREDTKLQNRMIRDSMYGKIKDPTKTFVDPSLQPEVPHFDFSPLENALKKMRHSIDNYAKALKELEHVSHSNQKMISRLNNMIYKSERYLLAKKGVPERKWYKNLICAPGLYTGYAVSTLPGIRQELEQHHYSEVEPQIKLLGKTLRGFNQHIKKMVNMIKDSR